MKINPKARRRAAFRALLIKARRTTKKHPIKESIVIKKEPPKKEVSK